VATGCRERRRARRPRQLHRWIIIEKEICRALHGSNEVIKKEKRQRDFSMILLFNAFRWLLLRMLINAKNVGNYVDSERAVDTRLIR